MRLVLRSRSWKQSTGPEQLVGAPAEVTEAVCAGRRASGACRHFRAWCACTENCGARSRRWPSRPARRCALCGSRALTVHVAPARVSRATLITNIVSDRRVARRRTLAPLLQPRGRRDDGLQLHGAAHCHSHRSDLVLEFALRHQGMGARRGLASGTHAARSQGGGPAPGFLADRNAVPHLRCASKRSTCLRRTSSPATTSP